MRSLTLRIGGLVIVSAVLGCGDDEVDVWLGFPEVGSGETLVVVHGELERRRAVVLDPDLGPANVVIETQAGEPAPVALTLGGSAGAVGLPLGASPVVAPSDGRLMFGTTEAYFPGPPLGVFELRRQQDPAAATWQLVAPVPIELRSLAVPFTPTPCPQFAQPRWSEALMPFADGILESLDDEHALLVTRDVDGTDARWVASQAGIRSAGDGENVSLVIRFGERLWMGDLLGSLWWADADPTDGWSNKTRMPIEPLRAPIIGLATTGTVSDVFVGTGAGDIRYFNGNRWAILGNARVAARNMVSTVPGTAVFIDDRGRLIEATKDGLREIPDAPDTLHSVQVLDGFGIVISDERGTFFGQRNGEWVEVVPARFGWFGFSAAAYDNGLVFLLASGLGGFYSSETDLCEDIFGAGINTAGRVIPMGDDLVVAVNTASSSAFTVVWIDRVR